MKNKFKNPFKVINFLVILLTVLSTAQILGYQSNAVIIPVIDGNRDVAYTQSFSLTTSWNWGNPDWNQRTNTDGIQGTVHYYRDNDFVYFLVEATDPTPTTQWGAAYVPNVQKWDAIEVCYDTKPSVDGTDGVIYTKPNGGIFVASPSIAGGMSGEEAPGPLINTMGCGGVFQSEANAAQFYTGSDIIVKKVTSTEYVCEFRIPKKENSIYIGIAIRNQNAQTAFPSAPTSSYVLNASDSNANIAFSSGGRLIDLSQSSSSISSSDTSSATSSNTSSNTPTAPLIDGARDTFYEKSYQLTSTWNWGNPDWNQRTNTDGIQGTVHYYWDNDFVYFLVEATDPAPTKQWGAAYVPNVQKWDAIEVCYDTKPSVDGTDGVMYTKPNGGIFVASPNVAGGLSGEETPGALINTMGCGGVFQPGANAAQFYTGSDIIVKKVTSTKYACEFRIPKKENSIYIGIAIRNQNAQTVFPNAPTSSYVLNASDSNANIAFSSGGKILNLIKNTSSISSSASSQIPQEVLDGIQIDSFKDAEYKKYFSLRRAYKWGSWSSTQNVDQVTGKVNYYWDKNFVYFLVEATDPTSTIQWGATYVPNVQKWDAIEVCYNAKPSVDGIDGVMYTKPNGGIFVASPNVAGGVNGKEPPAPLVNTMGCGGVFQSDANAAQFYTGKNISVKKVNSIKYISEFKIPRKDKKMYIGIAIRNQNAQTAFPIAPKSSYVVNGGQGNANIAYVDGGVMLDLTQNPNTPNSLEEDKILLDGFKDSNYSESRKIELNWVGSYELPMTVENTGNVQGKVYYEYDRNNIYLLLQGKDPTVNNVWGYHMVQNNAYFDHVRFIYNSKPSIPWNEIPPVPQMGSGDIKKYSGSISIFPNAIHGLKGEGPVTPYLINYQRLGGIFDDIPEAGVVQHKNISVISSDSKGNFSIEIKIPRQRGEKQFKFWMGIHNQFENTTFKQGAPGLLGYIVATGPNGDINLDGYASFDLNDQTANANTGDKSDTGLLLIIALTSMALILLMNLIKNRKIA